MHPLQRKGTCSHGSGTCGKQIQAGGYMQQYPRQQNLGIISGVAAFGFWWKRWNISAKGWSVCVTCRILMIFNWMRPIMHWWVSAPGVVSGWVINSVSGSWRPTWQKGNLTMNGCRKGRAKKINQREKGRKKERQKRRKKKQTRGIKKLFFCE